MINFPNYFFSLNPEPFITGYDERITSKESYKIGQIIFEHPWKLTYYDRATRTSKQATFIT